MLPLETLKNATKSFAPELKFLALFSQPNQVAGWSGESGEQKSVTSAHSFKLPHRGSRAPQSE